MLKRINPACIKYTVCNLCDFNELQKIQV